MTTKRKPKVPKILDEAVSAAGRRVTLALECNQYRGARPFLTVTYWGSGGRQPARQLHSPYPRRARAFFAALLRDVTDVPTLMRQAPQCLAHEALAPSQTTKEVA